MSVSFKAVFVDMPVGVVEAIASGNTPLAIERGVVCAAGLYGVASAVASAKNPYTVGTTKKQGGSGRFSEWKKNWNSERGSVDLDAFRDLFKSRNEGSNASPNTLGKQGEKFVSNELGLPHNTKTISINDRDRIPDFFDSRKGIIAESKKVAKQSYTRQLRDYVDKANEMGTKLELYVRQNTKLSKPLQEAIDKGVININYFSW